MPKNQSGTRVMPFLMAASLVAYVGLVVEDLSAGTLRAGQTLQTLFWFGLAFLAYLGIIIGHERWKLSVAPGIWLAAISFRVLLLLTTPTLSDDVYRYIWDGHVVNNGVSPYSYRIDAAALDYLDVPARSLANNTWMASPYLPGAQLLFAILLRLFSLKPIFFQVSAAIFDLLSGLLIHQLLRLCRLPPRRVLLYLLHPLIIVESAHGAHIDSWMIFLTLSALWLALVPVSRPSDHHWRTRLASPAVLAVATLTKLIPVLIMPVLFWRWPKPWRALFVYSLLILVILLPFGLTSGWGLTGALDGVGLFGALRIYADQWNFNSGIFHWLEAGFSATSSLEPNTLARRVSGVAMLAVAAISLLRGRHSTNPRQVLRLASLPLGAYLLLTTTLHPWYLLVFIAFLPFLPPDDGEPRGRWLLSMPWLYLSGAVFLSYLTYFNPNDYRELEWVRQVEWLPTLGLFAVAIVWSLTRRGGKLALVDKADH